jgi:hypothetical protein
MVLFLRPRLLHYHMYMRAHCQNKCAPNLHTHPLMLQGAQYVASQGAEWRHTHRTHLGSSHIHTDVGCISHTFMESQFPWDVTPSTGIWSLRCTGLKSSDLDVLDNNWRLGGKFKLAITIFVLCGAFLWEYPLKKIGRRYQYITL